MYKIICLSLLLMGFVSCDGLWPKKDTAEAEASEQYGAELPSDAELFAVIEENFAAMEAEDLDRTMATLDPPSGSYAQTEQMIQHLFDTYEISYEIEEIAVLDKSEDEAQVEVTQLTQKVSGPAFRDNRLTAINTLHKRDGVWKITLTDVQEMKYLN